MRCFCSAILIMAALMLNIFLRAASQSSTTAPLIGYHESRVDSTGQIIPGAISRVRSRHPNSLGFLAQHARVLQWRAILLAASGLVARARRSKRLGRRSDQHGAGFVELLYGYLGDPTVKQNTVEIADYWLERGIADSGLPWGDLPYPYNTDLHSGKYDGDMRAGKDFLQPDKAGSAAPQ